jgi:hypothetical protein
MTFIASWLPRIEEKSMTFWKAALGVLVPKRPYVATRVPVAESAIKLVGAEDIDWIVSTFSK